MLEHLIKVIPEGYSHPGILKRDSINPYLSAYAWRFMIYPEIYDPKVLSSRQKRAKREWFRIYKSYGIFFTSIS